MKPGSDPAAPEIVRSVIRSHDPSLPDEIQGAIRTLQKLQKIAGPPGDAPVPHSATPTLNESDDGSTPAPAAPPVDMTYLAGEEDDAMPVVAPRMAAGDSFGRYQVVRMLGQGGMGSVYLAYDGELHRHVALKTPLLNGGAPALQRFLREARAVAQLQSPYVCPVYDVGQLGGIYYLSMAFIDGEPLSRHIAEKRLGDARGIAVLMQKIARGLQKAHEQGIIHRDIKPENIMINRDGDPVIMDFGLAWRPDDQEVRLTAPGRLLGTPAYMSPEQVDADASKVGPATDIYSLGVVLYEILTGCVPFRGSFTAVLRQVVSEAPKPPSALNPALGPAFPLEPICLKMLAKSPADRYSSMAEVVKALEEAFPTYVTPPPAPSAWQRLSSWARGVLTRKPRPATSAPVAPAAPPVAPSVPRVDVTQADPELVTPGHSRAGAEVGPAREVTQADSEIAPSIQRPAALSNPNLTQADSGVVRPVDLQPQTIEQTVDLPAPR